MAQHLFIRMIRISVILGFATFFAPLYAAEAPEAATPCMDCHGENGISEDSDIPTLAGASAFFLENQLLVYREKARPCAKEEFEEEEHEKIEASDHCALSNDLSKEEIAQIAEYFSSQPFVPAKQSVDEALAQTGAKIHDLRCAKCHSEGGSLSLDDAGILAGQWKDYLLEQFRHYQAGERWQPEKMQPHMEKLDESDMKALAEYYASQGEQRF